MEQLYVHSGHRCCLFKYFTTENFINSQMAIYSANTRGAKIKFGGAATLESAYAGICIILFID